MPKGQHGSKAPHGTRARYNGHGCRCDECREAATRYHRERRGAMSLAEYHASVAVPHGGAAYKKGCRSFSDRELTRLQETGSVVVGHSMVDGVRLTAITAALLLLGIDPEDVVLHGTGADHIAVTVKPDA